MKNKIIAISIVIVVSASLIIILVLHETAIVSKPKGTSKYGNFRLEKENLVRAPRSVPLKLFRAPKIKAAFVGFSQATLELTRKLRVSNVEIKKEPSLPSLTNELRTVEEIESLVKREIADEDLATNMIAFGHVSTTVTARLLACYNALISSKKTTPGVTKLFEMVNTLIAENSDVVYFEIMSTFNDTYSAFPEVSVNFLILVDTLIISNQEKQAYYETYLKQKLSQKEFGYDENRERSFHLALEKLKSLNLEESKVSTIVDGFIETNSSDPEKRYQAITMTKEYFPDHFGSQESGY